jgi:hypothetical protein
LPALFGQKKEVSKSFHPLNIFYDKSDVFKTEQNASLFYNLGKSKKSLLLVNSFFSKFMASFQTHILKKLKRDNPKVKITKYTNQSQILPKNVVSFYRPIEKMKKEHFQQRKRKL